jgi:hypothetical protein
LENEEEGGGNPPTACYEGIYKPIETEGYETKGDVLSRFDAQQLWRTFFTDILIRRAPFIAVQRAARTR